MNVAFLTLCLSMMFNVGCQAQNKTLVAYFSAQGHTREAAKKLSEAKNADIFEIVPEKLYSADDLDYRNQNARCMVEMKDKTSRPKISGKVNNWSSYSVVYVGYPIWCNLCPQIIRTFIESYDFKGKTVIPFCTCGGGSVENSIKDLKASYPSLNWKDGKKLNDATVEQLRAWN